MRLLTRQLLFTSIALCLFGCSLPKGSLDEGSITYEVSFPFLENSILKNVFPEEMTLLYKENLVRGDIRSLGGIVSSGFVADSEQREYQQLLKNYQDYYKVILDQEATDAFVATQPALRFEATDETMMIAGFECQLTIAHFQTDSVPPVKLYHTDEIDIDNPNWFNQYREIEDVLLGYEIEQFGMRMQLMAKEVTHDKINKKAFEVDPQYKTVEMAEFRNTIRQLLEGITEPE